MSFLGRIYNKIFAQRGIFDIKSEIAIKQELIDIQQKLVESLEQKVSELTARDKALKRSMIEGQTKYNQMVIDLSNDVSFMVYERLKVLEKYKKNGLLSGKFEEEARELFLLLCEYGGRFNSRYVKMPDEWPALGLYAGILEDLIVVLRTPSQIGLGDRHMYTLEQLYKGFYDFYNSADEQTRDLPRFMFLTYLFKSMIMSEALEVIAKCIASQGNSKRVGMYNHDPDGLVYVYAIQGILGKVQFDDRVTKLITLDNCNPYAVHFTKTELALKIWNKEETTTNKMNNRTEPIYPGCICRFERPVHALSNIKLEDGKYSIYTVDKDIRTRMVHGIRKNVARPKYQAGLVIDVRKMLELLPAGSVRQNEIGTLLVNADIPHECLLYCIHTPEDIEIFWNGQ